MSSRKLQEPRLLVSKALLIPHGTMVPLSSFIFYLPVSLCFFSLNCKKSWKIKCYNHSKVMPCEHFAIHVPLSLIKVEMPWSSTNTHIAQKLKAVLLPLLFRNLLTAGKSLPCLSN